jgi:hypothetical protein
VEFVPLSADDHDALHGTRTVEREAHWLRDRVARLEPAAQSLLHVACRTGAHDEYLAAFYEVDGLDERASYLDRARRRNPRGTYHCVSLTAFRLDRLYDGILCLGGAIASTRTTPDLRQALQSFYDHLTPRGFVAVEPGPGMADFEWPSLAWQQGGGPERRVVGLTRRHQRRVGDETLAVLQHSYLCGTVHGATAVEETEEIGLFARDDLRRALEQSGFHDVHHDPTGPGRRGLLLARAGRGGHS